MPDSREGTELSSGFLGAKALKRLKTAGAAQPLFIKESLVNGISNGHTALHQELRTQQGWSLPFMAFRIRGRERGGK